MLILMLRDDKKLTKMPLWTDCWTAKSDIHSAATQRGIALDAISKAESSRLRGRRNGHVIWTKGEQDHDESVTADIRALNASLSSGFNQMTEFQTRRFNRMLEQQKQHTQILEKILETQTKFLSESSQPRFQSRSPGRPEGFRRRTSAMQCYNCREFRHLSNQCPHKGTTQPGISTNVDTDRQPIVKAFYREWTQSKWAVTTKFKPKQSLDQQFTWWLILTNKNTKR